jgi:hypothetical protein
MQSSISNTQKFMQYTRQRRDRRRMRRWQPARQHDRQPAQDAGSGRVTITIHLDLAPAAPAGKPWRAQQRGPRAGYRTEEERALAAPRYSRWAEHPRAPRGDGRRGAMADAFSERRYSRWRDRRAIQRWQGKRARREHPAYL